MGLAPMEQMEAVAEPFNDARRPRQGIANGMLQLVPFHALLRRAGAVRGPASEHFGAAHRVHGGIQPPRGIAGTEVPMVSSGLSPLRRRFVEEYLIDLNATQAAIRAGYSPRGATAVASRLLRKGPVAAAVAEAMAARSARVAVDADWMLRRLVAEVEADLADLYDADGDLRPVADWPAVWRQGLVAGIETASDRAGAKVRKVRLCDRLRRIELIGRHVDVQAFRERIGPGASDDLAARLDAAEQRLAARASD